LTVRFENAVAFGSIELFDGGSSGATFVRLEVSAISIIFIEEFFGTSVKKGFQSCHFKNHENIPGRDSVPEADKDDEITGTFVIKAG
jgi:hypothetical protein